jgi:hypothetical protein
MITLDFRTIARALGGEVVGRQVLAPGPGHSRADRSMVVLLSPSAPEGFIVFSYAGDDWKACRDYARERLGPLCRSDPRSRLEARKRLLEPRHDDDDCQHGAASALALWHQGSDPRGTPAERYLASRCLDLGDDLAGEVLRWHPRIGAMIALFRDVVTDDPRAVSRIYLDRDGRKMRRAFLGPVGGAAIKLDVDEVVLGGLHIGEGVETCLAAQQLGLRPTWALGSAGAIAAFPVPNGIETLTIIVDHDETGTGEKAARACEVRWLGAGKEVVLLRSDALGDFNDVLKAVAS